MLKKSEIAINHPFNGSFRLQCSHKHWLSYDQRWQPWQKKSQRSKRLPWTKKPIWRVEKQCAELLDVCKRLRDKCNNLESHSRHINIRLIGVAEKEENGRPTEFIAELLPKLLFQKTSANLSRLIVRTELSEDREIIIQVRLSSGYIISKWKS